MSNGVFYSGDLSTAASRRLPPPVNAEDKAHQAPKQEHPAASPPPLYAKFRQSTSPLMSNGLASNTSTPSEVGKGPISPGQSFLQIDDSKSDQQARANTSAAAPSGKIESPQQKKEVETPQKGRQPRGPVPSLTTGRDDPFYHANVEYASAKQEASQQPLANQKNTTGSKFNNNIKNTSTTARDDGQDALISNRSKPASASVGNRILSNFRSTTHHKAANLVHVKVVQDPTLSAATHPTARTQPEQGGKPSVANIFSAFGSAGTAREEDDVSELAQGDTVDSEGGNNLSDSGLGQSPAKLQGGKDGGDKPNSPQEVLTRTGKPRRPVNAIELIAGVPPSTSSKALDRLIGTPIQTPAKAVSTLSGIKVTSQPPSENYDTGAPDARQSVFSIRSDTSTIATTYKEGKDDADESDIDTTASTLGPLIPGSLPRGGRSYPSTKSNWDRERERKASAHSTSSDSSAAAVFYPPPPVPTVSTRMLASGPFPSSKTKNQLLRQAVTVSKRHTTADSLSIRPDIAESSKVNLRPIVLKGDAALDAMSSGDDGLRPGTGISAATFETALSHPDKQLIDNGNFPPPVTDSNAEGCGSRLPSSVLVPRRKPTTRIEKRFSKALSDAPSIGSQQSTQTYATIRDSPRKTLASLYLVAGLPKDPNNWALAEHDFDIGLEASHMENAVPRWFKAEVLGSMVSGGGEAALDALEGFQGRNVNGSKYKGLNKKGRHAHGKTNISTATPMTTIEEQPTLSKEEIAKIQAKAIKLSMPRDVEIIAAGTAPPATSHTFSFTIKAVSTNSSLDRSGSIKGALGASWDLALAQSARPASTDRDDTTYYGASLIVWTHADKTRTDAIRAAIEVGSRARSLALARAAKAAAAGRKFGERIARQQGPGRSAPLGSKGKTTGTGKGNVTSGGETEFETEVYMESEWEGRGSAPLNASATELPFLKSSTFWLPYALTLVSKYPIYDLLSDTLRLSWARYHLNIARHSLTMRKLLEFPAPRPSERFKIPVDPLADAEGAFVMRFPGKVSLNSITADIDFQIWPVLRCLDADNLLRVAEIALSPFGRVVFFCQHVHMLNVAVETFRHLLEPRGWKGIVHGVVHTRDIKVYIEDPGPFLIGIDSRCINIAREKVDPEICYVDLETNDVRCQQPPPGSLFRGAQRERLVKKLSEAIGHIGYYGVPPELTDAFPGSRFRPFSQVEVNGRVAPAERLLAPANWNYNQDRFLSTFDTIISIRPNTNVLQRLLHLKNSVRKAAELTTNAQHVQQLVRNQSNNFVDKRDLMEAKLWRMNKRLALLMQESQSWNSQFTQFQGFTEKLSNEASDLRTKLEKERREAKRLSGVVYESKQAQEDLSKKLVQAEEAHKEAMQELERIEEFRQELQDQRDDIFNEMASLAASTEDHHMLDDIATKLEMRSDAWSVRSASAAVTSSPSLMRSASKSSMTLLRAHSKASMRSTRAAPFSPTSPGASSNNGFNRSRKTSTASNATTQTLAEVAESGTEHGHEDRHEEVTGDLGHDLEEEDEYLEVAVMRRMAITETMRSIQERLQTALATAQARARSAALSSPTPGVVASSFRREGSTSPLPGHQVEERSSTASPEFLIPKSPSAARSKSPVSEGAIANEPRVPQKSKSRNVVGHPGSNRRVEVPTSASESDEDA